MGRLYRDFSLCCFEIGGSFLPPFPYAAAKLAG
jgi:hypothetical protein